MFDGPMTRHEIADLWGVSTACIDEWTLQGMPTLAPGVSRTPQPGEPAGPRSWAITRRGFAELVGKHPDTIPRMLPSGLEAAVQERGPRGTDLILDARLALRFFLASEGRLDAIVLDDFKACTRRSIPTLAQLSAGSLFHVLGQGTAEAGDDSPRPARRQRGTR